MEGKNMINLERIQSIDMIKYFRLFVLIIVLTAVFYLGFEISQTPNAFSVMLDGEVAGIILEEETADNLLNEVKLSIEKDLGGSIEVCSELFVEPVRASQKEIISKDELLTKLKNSLSYDIKAYVIKVDGVEQATLINNKEAEEVLEKIKAKYIEEGIKPELISFVEEVKVEPKCIKVSDEMIAVNDAVELLTKSTEAQRIYTIEEGDTLWGISERYGLSIEDILKANPGLEEEGILQIGQEINLNIPKPILSVMTKEEFTYTEPIEKPVRYVEDDTQYKTYIKVIEPGEEGEKEITAYKIKINGYEEGTEIISEKVIKEPKESVVVVGTKTPPPKSATGSFRMPTSGTLTSTFGYRWGRFHAGIDLAAPIGTPVYAADGGTVVEAGWHGGYGYLVRINHGNGFESYYAHLSKIYVQVGQKVAKGEQIAAMGSTGNSTGSHLHFEIRLNGEAKNPYNYLK